MESAVTLTDAFSRSLVSVLEHPTVGLYFSPTPPVFELKSEVAAIIYGASAPFWLTCSFMVWYLMNETRMFMDSSIKNTYKSLVDVYQWWLHVGAWGQLLIFFAIVLAYDSAITR